MAVCVVGNKERPLRYTIDDRIELEERFGKDIVALVREDVLPRTDDKGRAVGVGRLAAQIALVWVGVRHEQPSYITEKRVKDWFAQLVKEGRPIIEPVAQAVAGLAESGVVAGVVVAEEAGEGKAPPGDSGASSGGPQPG